MPALRGISACIPLPSGPSNQVGIHMGNTFKTAFLLTALTLLLMAAGRALGGQNGMLLALGIAAVTNFVAYFFSDKIPLRTYRAQPPTPGQLPRCYSLADRMTQNIALH